MLTTVKQTIGRNSKTNNPSCPGFKFVRYFIHVHHEDPIKTECVILVQMSNRGVFSNVENVTLRLIIRSGQFRTDLRFHPRQPYMQVSGRSDQN